MEWMLGEPPEEHGATELILQLESVSRFNANKFLRTITREILQTWRNIEEIGVFIER